MKKIILIFLCLVILKNVRAEEGMWIPIFLKSLNEKDMKVHGMKISADDIFSLNQASVKDAIVHFGGGCTGEIVSDQGLLITNHHCGYSAIQTHSSVDHDYLTDGYWAMNKSQELPNQSLTATFIIRIEDVTNDVLKGVTNLTSEAERNKIINDNTVAIQKKSVEGTHYESYIRPFFNGNSYLLFITEVFKDVRLVGAPPSSIGKFGGDTDNWMWPRHTGDFSIFRIYANKENKPAEYSLENVPYKPKKVLSISLKGVKENDFTMIFGFPGRTTEYLSSYAVSMIKDKINPLRISIRGKKLDVWNSFMENNDTLRIQYAAKHASVSNAYKKWQGEIYGLERLDAVNVKRNIEAELKKTSYGKSIDSVLTALKEVYDSYVTPSVERELYGEAGLSIELLGVANTLRAGVSKFADKTLTGEPKKKEIDALKMNVNNFFKTYRRDVDKAVTVELFKIYGGSAYAPKWFKEIAYSYRHNYDKMGEDLFKTSILTNKAEIVKLIETPDKLGKRLEKDKFYSLLRNMQLDYSARTRPQIIAMDSVINKLNRLYMFYMMKAQPEKVFYPDANSTLRVGYGNVKSYTPRDGVYYSYFTTLDGIMEKEDSTITEFIVPGKLKELYNSKDYGMYMDSDSTMHVAFIASNHTTGGNSGSPVLNAEGQLIGVNFDRNWEGTMSDIMYDPSQTRNISIDIRYLLFVVDKFAGAGYLLDEMTIIK